MGRPTKFSKDMADRICRQLALGRTLRAICREEEWAPHRDTVNDWVIDNAVFSDQVARAREMGTHELVDESREIADDGSNDWMEKRDKDGVPIGWQLNGEHVQRSKLRIETRYREAEALAPKVYGKRQMIEHSGGLHVTQGSDADLEAELLNLFTSGRLKLPGGMEIIELDDEDDIAGPLAEPDEDDFSDIA